MEKCRLDVRRYTFLTLTVRGDWPVWRLCRLSLGKQPRCPSEMILCGPSSLSGLLSEETTHAAGNRGLSRRAWKERPSPFVNISQHVSRFTLVHFPTLNWKMAHCWLSATAYSHLPYLRKPVWPSQYNYSSTAWMIGVRILSGVRDLSLLQNLQTCIGTHSAS